MEASVIQPNAHSSSQLCGKCETMDFWASKFRIEDTWSELSSSLNVCDFCKLRWDVSKHLDRTDYTSVSFEIVDSMLKMSHTNSPVLSICRSPGKQNVRS